MSSRSCSRWLLWGSAVELGLGTLALGLGWILAVPFWRQMDWTLRSILLGVLASLPLFLVFLWILKSPWRRLEKIREPLERAMRPAFADCAVAQLGWISLLAGVGEELFFRGFLQSILTQHTGWVMALLLTNLLFGAVHFFTLEYAIGAAVMGVYFGLLQVFGDNLLIPIVAHGMYDFLALVYFLRRPAAPAAFGPRER